MLPPDTALGLGAAFGFVYLVPVALLYLGWGQRRRHIASSVALFAAAVAILSRLFVTGYGWAGFVRALDGQGLFGLGAVSLAAVGWKLALRRRPGFRDGETVAERLLPMLIVADLLLLLLAWPALAEWLATPAAG